MHPKTQSNNDAILHEAETLVVAALLTEHTTIQRVEELLRPDMFQHPAYRALYAGIEEMNRKGQAIDLLTVANALQHDEEVARAGGISFLAELSGKLVSTIHLEDHAAIVFNASINRRLFLFATQLATQARTGELAGEELLLRAHQQLAEIDRSIPLFNALKDAPTVVADARQAGLERVRNYRAGQTITGISTDLPSLNQMLGGWQNGDLIVLAARPSIGKTALALHFVKAAIEEGKHTLIYSLEMNARRHFNRQDLVSEASNEAKRMAKELDVPVILLSQLNRGLESRPGKRPELADLRDSGAIEQDADVVVLIHRPEFYGILEDRHGNSTVGRGELIVAKHRNGDTGMVGFGYNRSMTRIE